MKPLVLSAAFAVAASGAYAGTISIDFEDKGPQDLSLGTEYQITDGVTATSTENMQLVQTGSPTDGFVPDDMPIGGSFGRFFLTGDFVDNTDLILSFATAVKGLSFEIADIDGGGSNNTEMFTFAAYLNNGLVQSIPVNSGDAGTGNAAITEIMFGDDVVLDELRITGVTNGGTRNIGWGIDNIHATAVPLPAAGWLLVGAFGGLAAMKRRRKTA